MGPRGNNVIFRKLDAATAVTHDGVTVAKAVKLDDPTEDIGADLLREAASKLDAVTGDGTTTVTVLAYHILKEAIAEVEKGQSPMVMKLKLDEQVRQVDAMINDHTMQEPTKKQLVQVATVAAGDETIGERVGELIFEAGAETPVTLGMSEDGETNFEIARGFRTGTGPASPYLLQGAGSRLEVVEPKVIVCDASIRTKDEILPLLRVVAELPPEDKKVLLVVQDIAGDALSILVVNRLQGFAEIAVSKVPSHINDKSRYLQDVAVSTGAKVLAFNTAHTLSQPSVEDFGGADKVIVELDDTIIIGGHADEQELAAHLEAIKEPTKNPDLKRFNEERLKKLSQEAIIVRVGGQSDSDANERYYRFEDAIGASQAALRGGVVPGGGTLLYYIADNIEAGPLSRALRAPLLKVYGNAGITEVKEEIKPGFGYDVKHPDRGMVDLVKVGILDPALSEKESVKTAAAIAGLLLTSGAMIVDERTPDETASALPRFS